MNFNVLYFWSFFRKNKIIDPIWDINLISFGFNKRARPLNETEVMKLKNDDNNDAPLFSLSPTNYNKMVNSNNQM